MEEKEVRERMDKIIDLLFADKKTMDDIRSKTEYFLKKFDFKLAFLMACTMKLEDEQDIKLLPQFYDCCERQIFLDFAPSSLIAQA